jgi:hypothetical protein
MRSRAIRLAVYYAFVPWWMYEKKKHYRCSYVRHLWVNLVYALRWAMYMEDEDDIYFERMVNGRDDEL